MKNKVKSTDKNFVSVKVNKLLLENVKKLLDKKSNTKLIENLLKEEVEIQLKYSALLKLKRSKKLGKRNT